MPDDPQLLARLHEAVVGSPTLGEYPDTVMNRLMTALDAAWDLVEACGVANRVAIVDGQTLGPWSAPTDLLDDCNQQVRSRWRFDNTARWRNLPEAAQQLSNLLAVLVQTSPSPEPEPPSDDGTLLWAADPSGADSTAMGFQGRLIQRQWNGGSIQTSSDPVPAGTAPDGSRGLVFHLPAGMERLEVQPPVAQNITAGQEVWIGFWLVGDANVEHARDPWAICLQIHGNDSTSPHQIIAVDGGDFITGNGSTLKRFYNGRVKANTRYDVVVHASATSGGPMSVWVNDELVLNNYRAGLNNTPGYVKHGLYRQPAGSPDQTLWMGGMRIGGGYSAVRPQG